MAQKINDTGGSHSGTFPGIIAHNRTSFPNIYRTALYKNIISAVMFFAILSIDPTSSQENKQLSDLDRRKDFVSRGISIETKLEKLNTILFDANISARAEAISVAEKYRKLDTKASAEIFKSCISVSVDLVNFAVLARNSAEKSKAA